MEKSILQTVDRALVVLELLASEKLTATDIQKKLDLNKSTVHRLMMTLLNRGFVEKDELTNQYTIGIKLVEMSSIRLNQVELKTEAAPFLLRLANMLDQSIQLAVLDKNEAMFIEKVEKYQSLHMYCQIGKRIPLYCSAVGKTLLMDHSDQEIRELFKTIEFERFTDHTRQSVDQVLEDITASRSLSYAKDESEHEEGVYCIAMPIRDYRNKIVAAVSITGLSTDIYEEAGKDKRNALSYTCLEISKKLGFIEK